MSRKKLKILLIVTPILTVLAIVLCIVFAKTSDTKKDGENEGFLLDTDSVNTFAICRDPDCVFIFGNNLCVCKNGVLMIYDKNGSSKDYDLGLNIVRGEYAGDSMYFIDDKDDLYEFNTKSEKTELVMNSVSDVSMGGYINGALTTDGRIFMWGETAGRFVGQNGNVTKPTEYKCDVHWTKISFGTHHMLALDDSGNVYEAYLHDEQQKQLKKIEKLNDISQIYCRAENIAVSKDGTIHYWINTFGSGISDPMTDDYDKIEIVLNELKPTHFSLYFSHSIAYNDNNAYFWGEEGPSRENKSVDYIRSPKLCKSLTNYDSIYCGENVIFKKNGIHITAYCLHC